MISDIEHIFMPIGHVYVLFGEMSIQVLCPFFNWVVCPPSVELCKFFVYFGDKPFIRCTSGKYVLPFS